MIKKEGQMKTCVSMLNKDFSALKVSAMISSLHKNNEVSSVLKCVNIKKISNGEVTTKLQHCIFVDVDSAIDYLSKKIQEKKDNYFSVRKEWLRILKFAKKNHSKLVERHIIDKESIA